MLRNSSRSFANGQRLLHFSRTSNQADSKAVSDAQENLRIKILRVPDKMIYASNLALARYNEIIGFAEIDQAYQKVTVLQVRSLMFDGKSDR